MRIAIVNDMEFVTRALAHTIEAGDRHTIAWTASGGAQAIRKCAGDKPDLLLMDMVMDGMDGVETTQKIMSENPCPILIVTATVQSNSGMVFQAMGHGALDVVATPTLANPRGAEMLLTKISQLELLLKKTRRGGVRFSSFSPPAHQFTGSLVVIGASAGGPAALSAILEKLPSSFPAAMVIVQHIDARFAPQLAEWLSTSTGFSVRLAVEGDSVQPGNALLADGNGHLVFKNSRELGYTRTRKSNAYVPSVDALFQSAATHWSGRLCGVLLTGMGKDGVSGLQLIHRSGSLTIAQDRQTSILYGMPKCAAEAGAASEVLPLHCIADRLYTWAQSPISKV